MKYDIISNNKKLIKDTDIDKLYTAKDLTDIFYCGINRAYDLMKSPAFPSVKIGNRYYVSKTALENWLKIYEGRSFIV